MWHAVQIVICSDNDEFPELKLTTFGTRQIFEQLREVRTEGGFSLHALCSHGSRMLFTGTCCRPGRRRGLPQQWDMAITWMRIMQVELGGKRAAALMWRLHA